MKQNNKKYTLNEGRVIGNSIINYGGFPKIIKEANAPTPSVITAQNPMNSDVAGGQAPQIPAGPPGILPPGGVPPLNTPEFDRWFIEWQEANNPRQLDGESREDYLIRRRAYEYDLWFQITWWIGQQRMLQQRSQ